MVGLSTDIARVKGLQVTVGGSHSIVRLYFLYHTPVADTGVGVQVGHTGFIVGIIAGVDVAVVPTGIVGVLVGVFVGGIGVAVGGILGVFVGNGVGDLYGVGTGVHAATALEFTAEVLNRGGDKINSANIISIAVVGFIFLPFLVVYLPWSLADNETFFLDP